MRQIEIRQGSARFSGKLLRVISEPIGKVRQGSARFYANERGCRHSLRSVMKKPLDGSCISTPSDIGSACQQARHAATGNGKDAGKVNGRVSVTRPGT